MALFYFAHIPSMRAASELFRKSCTVLIDIVHDLIQAICAHVSEYIQFPMGEQAKMSAAKFYTRGGILRVVAAINGTHAKILCPKVD